MRLLLRSVFSIILISLFWGCASMSDSVISTVSEEEYSKLDDYFYQILEYQFSGNKDSISQLSRELESIDHSNIFNNDYKAKIVGYKALTEFYLGRKVKALSLLEELQSISSDEELFWIVQSLNTEDKEESLSILLEGESVVFEPDRLNVFLAKSYLVNEMYGEAAAIYDSILLSNPPFERDFRVLRERSYLFLKNPPNSYEVGLLILSEQINISDLIDILYLETEYLEKYEKEQSYESLENKRYFLSDEVNRDFPLLRKDFAVFLFALIADVKEDQNMWIEYDQRFNPDLSNEMKEQMEGFSPIADVPLYKYYFYPVVYLVEDEILEMPDGENFFPFDLVQGHELIEAINNLKNRLK